MTALREEYRRSAQIQGIIEVLEVSVDLHYYRMLFILKELVEILFQLGLVKVLVSTETFLTRVNMLICKVIFSSVKKRDRKSFRSNPKASLGR